jgi:citronellol/citronellal dehydrogenase
VLTHPSRSLTGQFLIDEDVLKANGVTDFSQYRHPGVSEDELIADFFV